MGSIRGETQEDAARVQSPAPAGTSISTKTPSPPTCRTGRRHSEISPLPPREVTVTIVLPERACVYKQNPHLYYMRGD